jgi:hypothetical protein
MGNEMGRTKKTHIISVNDDIYNVLSDLVADVRLKSGKSLKFNDALTYLLIKSFDTKKIELSESAKIVLNNAGYDC